MFCFRVTSFARAPVDKWARIHHRPPSGRFIAGPCRCSCHIRPGTSVTKNVPAEPHPEVEPHRRDAPRKRLRLAHRTRATQPHVAHLGVSLPTAPRSPTFPEKTGRLGCPYPWPFLPRGEGRACICTSATCATHHCSPVHFPLVMPLFFPLSSVSPWLGHKCSRLRTKPPRGRTLVPTRLACGLPLVRIHRASMKLGLPAQLCLLCPTPILWDFLRAAATTSEGGCAVLTCP